MKNIFLICSFAVASAAFGMELPVPPASVEVDAEASTNVVLGASIRDLSEIRIAVGLESSPTNAITVAIGRDADEDGELSASEEVVSSGATAALGSCATRMASSRNSRPPRSGGRNAN